MSPLARAPPLLQVLLLVLLSYVLASTSGSDSTDPKEDIDAPSVADSPSLLPLKLARLPELPSHASSLLRDHASRAAAATTVLSLSFAPDSSSPTSAGVRPWDLLPSLARGASYPGPASVLAPLVSVPVLITEGSALHSLPALSPPQPPLLPQSSPATATGGKAKTRAAAAAAAAAAADVKADLTVLKAAAGAVAAAAQSTWRQLLRSLSSDGVTVPNDLVWSPHLAAAACARARAASVCAVLPSGSPFLAGTRAHSAATDPCGRVGVSLSLLSFAESLPSGAKGNATSFAGTGAPIPRPCASLVLSTAATITQLKCAALLHDALLAPPSAAAATAAADVAMLTGADTAAGAEAGAEAEAEGEGEGEVSAEAISAMARALLPPLSPCMLVLSPLEARTAVSGSDSHAEDVSTGCVFARSNSSSVSGQPSAFLCPLGRVSAVDLTPPGAPLPAYPPPAPDAVTPDPYLVVGSDTDKWADQKVEFSSLRPLLAAHPAHGLLKKQQRRGRGRRSSGLEFWWKGVVPVRRQTGPVPAAAALFAATSALSAPDESLCALWEDMCPRRPPFLASPSSPDDSSLLHEWVPSVTLSLAPPSLPPALQTLTFLPLTLAPSLADGNALAGLAASAAAVARAQSQAPMTGAALAAWGLAGSSSGSSSSSGPGVGWLCASTSREMDRKTYTHTAATISITAPSQQQLSSAKGFVISEGHRFRGQVQGTTRVLMLPPHPLVTANAAAAAAEAAEARRRKHGRVASSSEAGKKKSNVIACKGDGADYGGKGLHLRSKGDPRAGTLSALATPPFTEVSGTSQGEWSEGGSGSDLLDGYLHWALAPPSELSADTASVTPAAPIASNDDDDDDVVTDVDSGLTSSLSHGNSLRLPPLWRYADWLRAHARSKGASKGGPYADGKSPVSAADDAPAPLSPELCAADACPFAAGTRRHLPGLPGSDDVVDPVIGADEAEAHCRALCALVRSAHWPYWHAAIESPRARACAAAAAPVPAAAAGAGKGPRALTLRPSAAPLAADAGWRPFIAVVPQGQVLYVPPGWAYRETHLSALPQSEGQKLEGSVALEVSCPSSRMLLEHSLRRRVPQPYDPAWPPLVRLAVSRHYLHLLTTELYGPRPMMGELILSRHAGSVASLFGIHAARAATAASQAEGSKKKKIKGKDSHKPGDGSGWAAPLLDAAFTLERARALLAHAAGAADSLPTGETMDSKAAAAIGKGAAERFWGLRGAVAGLESADPFYREYLSRSGLSTGDGGLHRLPGAPASFDPSLRPPFPISPDPYALLSAVCTAPSPSAAAKKAPLVRKLAKAMKLADMAKEVAGIFTKHPVEQFPDAAPLTTSEKEIILLNHAESVLLEALAPAPDLFEPFLLGCHAGEILKAHANLHKVVV